jgi:hypothetical protein
VALNLRELREWPPEIADLAGSTREAAANHTNSADFYRSLATASTWEGDGGDAARAAMVATAGEHDGMAESLGKAATDMEHAQQQAEQVAQQITALLNYAAEAPTVQIDESTNQVIPPDTTYLDDEAAAKVAAKVAELQAQIAAALSQGEGVDADLAGAIATATGTPGPEVKTASSVEDLLLPGSGERQAPPSADSASQPDSLDSALDQLAGTPRPASSGAQEVGGSAAPVPLDPAKVEQFKALARQTMLRDGVAPDQIEARLDAMVAAARQPLKPYTPPEPDKMPPPGFAEGFADRWFDTEQGIKNLIGQGGPGAPGVWESWRDLLQSTNDQFADPVGTAVDEVKNALNSPSAAYYLGEKAADGAIAAPGLIFGGEGALIARAGALDDLAGAGAIPRELIDNPTPTGTFEHDTPTPLGDLPLPVDTVPDFGDIPGTGPYPLPERAQLTPPSDGSFFWSGRNADGMGIGPISAGGNGAADLIAGGSNATTLEGLLESNGINPPKWSPTDTYADNWWSAVSQMYAENSSGEVYAVIGPNLRPGNVWETVELPRLMQNPNVTTITVIDPATGIETTVFER